MPSLLPKQKTEIPALDLREIFEGEKSQRTVERVAKYVGAFYDKYTLRSDDEINRPNTITEQFFLQMPTVEAFESEIRLCQAIEAHAAGRISDLEIKAVLDDFLDAHTFQWFDGKRECKRGNFDDWADDENLVYLTVPEIDFGFVCNAIQAWLVKLLHGDLKIRMVRL